MKHNIIQTAKFTSKVGQYTITIERYDIDVKMYDKDGNLISWHCETNENRMSIKKLCIFYAKFHPAAYSTRISTSPTMWCALYDTKGNFVKQIY